MHDDAQRQPGDFEDDVEQSMEDKRDAVLAADATGMVASEVPPLVEEDRPAPGVP